MSNISQDTIFARLQADDETALRELFVAYYGGICQTIHRYIRDKNLVEDLAQEVFISLWEKRQQISITTSVKAYLHRMAVNEALGWIRKNNRYIEEEFISTKFMETTPGSEAVYLAQEFKDRITAAINQLPPRCRIIFQLSRFEELTYREIAQKLEISIKTVENQMSKALRILREKMRVY